MKQSEHELQNNIRIAVGKERTATLFRANVGKAWTGKKAICCGDMITLHEARPFSTGLPIGFPDLFGFRTLEITPEMVGKKLAVFAFIEVKTKQGRTSRAQEKMHAFLRDAGALGGVARSTEEALHLLHPSTEPPEMR